MDNLLHNQPIILSDRAINASEECAISVDYTLPDYCSDVTTVLKCLAYPYVQSRQLSGERLLIDGMATIRILYLDEDRSCVRSAELTAPFTCSFPYTGAPQDCSSVRLELITKYVNCRVLTSRRLEIRGAVTVFAYADQTVAAEIAMACENRDLHTRCCIVPYTVPGHSVEKIITISESLEFPETLPGAEMLLGGECKAVVTECKLLTGKAIIKGQIFVHQLYTDDLSAGTTHCLDFVIPYSQILDIENGAEGLPYDVDVQLLMDMERCCIGPDGGNTVLEVTAKLLIQLQVYHQLETTLLLDGYHSKCPVSLKYDEVGMRSFIGNRIEQTMLPLKVALPNATLQEIVDVWVQVGVPGTECKDGRVLLTDRLLVCMLLRDGDGQIQYFEQVEEYRLEYPCNGTEVSAHVKVTDVRYRVCDGCLELQVTMCVLLKQWDDQRYNVITEMELCKEKSYPKQRANVLMYYAQQGEAVWSIAKECHASPKQILCENDISEDLIPQAGVLTIPIVS